MPEVLARADDPMFGLYRVMRDDDTLDADAARDFDDALLLRIYREMKRLRVLDERMLTIQRQGRIGFYGEVKGQEATPIATGFAVEKDDWVFPALREGAIMLVRGFPLDRYVAQCFGNSCDVLKGRQMPSHYSGREVNQVAWSSCIGPQVPQAVGCAWAMKMQHKTSVALGFLGDGATSEADFHNAMNFAGVFKVPCVIVCQNNHWAISVPSKKQSASPTFASKAIAYGMPGVRVDGNDVLAVLKVLRDAIARARAGQGPTFVESVTYRIGAHSSSDDPTRYRSNEEVAAWTQKDPVERMRRVLQKRGLLDDAKEQALFAEVDAEVKGAIAKVESAPLPERETIFDDVYATLPWHLEEQKREMLTHPPAAGHGAAGH
jgi:pyruvate dehydrogenase E1 component alpha subunit/2-oxoisovalerate dehydrogenase E1 component alpha subunit